MAAMHLNRETFCQLLADEKPALVEFWAPWCVHCRNLEDDFERIASVYSDRLLVGKINIDDCSELAERHFIEYVPTLVIFAEGELIDFVISPPDYEAIAQFIEESL